MSPTCPRIGGQYAPSAPVSQVVARHHRPDQRKASCTAFSHGKRNCAQLGYDAGGVENSRTNHRISTKCGELSVPANAQRSRFSMNQKERLRLAGMMMRARSPSIDELVSPPPPITNGTSFPPPTST